MALCRTALRAQADIYATARLSHSLREPGHHDSLQPLRFPFESEAEEDELGAAAGCGKEEGLCECSPLDTASRAVLAANDQLTARRNITQVDETCEKCGNDKMSVKTMQLRSADEGGESLVSLTCAEADLFAPAPFLTSCTSVRFTLSTQPTPFHYTLQPPSSTAVNDAGTRLGSTTRLGGEGFVRRQCCNDTVKGH